MVDQRITELIVLGISLKMLELPSIDLVPMHRGKTADTTADDTAALFYKKGSDYISENASDFVLHNTGSNVYQKITTEEKAYQVFERTGDLTADPPVAHRYKPEALTAEPDAKVPNTNRYHYDRESISISVPEDTRLIESENLYGFHSRWCKCIRTP